MPKSSVPQQKKNEFCVSYRLRILIDFASKVRPVKTKLKRQVQRIMWKVLWLLYILRKDMIMKTLNLKIRFSLSIFFFFIHLFFALYLLKSRASSQNQTRRAMSASSSSSSSFL